MINIQTELEYEEALDEIENLFFVEMNTPQGDRLELLSKLINEYEENHYQIKEIELITV